MGIITKQFMLSGTIGRCI